MPIPVNINELLHAKAVESSRIEFKADYNPAPILRTICAFANDIDNMGGGYIVIGVEEEKGNALVKATLPLLKECTDINFVGCIEARDIPRGGADVIVCEAFVGNVILKLYEGLSSTLIGVIKQGLMSTLKSKIGAALALPALKKTIKSFDASEYGGAPLLGLNGLVVKTHGSAKAKEITNSIFQCVTFNQEDINGKIKENIKDSQEEE